MSSARVHHAALGDPAEARDSYPGDEALVRQLVGIGYPVHAVARATRAFHLRAVSFVTAGLGIGQIVEIGPGLPPHTTPATHHIVTRHHHTRTRVLYIDHDPEVTAHLNTAYEDAGSGIRSLTGDLRQPDDILTDIALHLDLRKPVALVATGVLDQIADHEQPHAAVRRLLNALPTRSALVATHLTHEHDPQTIHRAARLLTDAGLPTYPRGFEEIAAFFTHLTPIGPGLVPTAQWHPTHTDNHAPPTDHTYSAIGHLT
ncbi:SAM-dependent methyltransferase [Streptomyces sp. NPDC059248]|uniref:SAM-dependent methyltransferase n=1 Tax=Streptomyces sp. NPDC059248 TaxID=3346791 RepID=UPI0036C17189